ncbi:nicotinate phosphoribosyltransferase, partial [Alphaproteobacteria bacterium]|nr:nicotinate phosphoribosyltransferase [Alphaproteobacteria bacterium]
MSEFASSGPPPEEQPSLTDTYFKHTREIVRQNGDCEVTYAVFMRRPVTVAARLAIEWLEAMAKSRNTELTIEVPHIEGSWIGAGEPICYINGPLSVLVDLETIFLQRLGAACVAAYNAYNMCVDLPKVAFLAMDARHCAGSEMAELVAYGASVGSEKAKKKMGAVGFVGCAADATAHFFGRDKGAGTMP